MLECEVKDSKTAADISRRWFVIALIALSLAAFGSRFYKIGEWSYEVDEFNTLNEISGEHPLFASHFFGLAYVPMWASSKVLGQNEFALRLPGAIFGAIAIPLLALFASRMSSRRAALLAGALLLLNWYSLFHSQNARYYTFAFLVAGIASFLFYYATEKSSGRLAFASGFFFIIGGLVHFTALLPLFAAVVYLAAIYFVKSARPENFRWKTLLWFALPFALGLFKIHYLFTYVMTFAGRVGLQTATASGGYSGIETAARIILSTTDCLTIPVVVLAFFGIIAAYRREKRLGLFFGAAFIIPMLALVVCSFAFPVAKRYSYASTMMWFASAGLALDYLMSLSRERKWNVMSFAVVLLVLGLMLPEFAFYYKDGARPPYKQALEYVNKNALPGDTVVMNVDSYVLTKAYQIEELHYVGITGEQQMHWPAEKLSAHAQGRTWYVLHYRRAGLPPAWYKWLWRNCVGMKTYAIERYGYMQYNIDVFLYDPALRPVAPETQPAAQ